MEFFSVATLKVAKWETIKLLRSLLNFFKSITMEAFTHLDLLNSSEQTAHSIEERAEDPPTYLLLINDPSPFLVSVPVHVLTARIKKLAVTKFSDFLDRKSICEKTQENHQEVICSICLDCLERSHEIRELVRCEHVFHKECLDSWIDQGQLTCPLCRSFLFPALGGKGISQVIHR
ncbi:hypothetical protein UlMin_001657 [Ulmus minor]